MTQEPADGAVLDLDAYLDRIGYAGGRQPSPDTLAALHIAHATRIPFENLDVLLGRPIRLDLASLQAKLVAGGRGGYCFEQNLLFAAALRALGFSVTCLAARVRFGTTVVLPRTHMTLLVDVDGGRWIADVGFGAQGLLLPVPLHGAREARQYAWTYRIVAAGGTWILQTRGDASWDDLYEFSLEPQVAADYEMASHYTSTHPASRFTHTLAAQRIAPELRCILRNREYSEVRGTGVTRRTLADDAEILQVLAEVFGLRFPAGTRFPFLGTAA